MTEASTHTTPRPADNGQAGALLRAARQQQGLHIAALAASIKVTPAKLEALESGRYHELPDATFTRALALTVCRVLKIDPAPVLAQLPGAPSGSLHRVDGGLNAPFRERPGRTDVGDWVPWRHPVLWLVGLLLLAAAAFVLVPSAPVSLAALPGLGAALPSVMPPSGAAVSVPPGDGTVPVPAADAASAALLPVTPAAVPSTPQEGVAPAAAQAEPASAPVSAGSAAADALVLRALQATWVQATDASGQVLMARLVPAGETVELTPALPVRLRIGNAQGTELQFRGQPVALPKSRENIANITLP